MIPKGLFSQIAMIILSVAILFTYVKPAFEEIEKVQDDIGVYKLELTKVVTVNEKLSSLVDRLESVSNEDERRLVTYLPAEVDDIAVQRDLSLIVNQSGVVLKEVSYQGGNTSRSARQQTEDQNPLPNPYTFSLSVEGRYEQIKQLFSLLEQNDYPLEIRGVDISAGEGGFLNAQIGLFTYQYRSEFINN